MLTFKKGQTYICTKSDSSWWTVGKEYKVFLDSDNEPVIKDDNGDKRYSSYVRTFNNQFKLKEEQPKVTLDEPQKPVVPKFVAEWFEENKDNLDNTIFGYLVFWEERDTSSELYQWFAKSENNPIETLIRMKDGYEVEKKPKYIVKIGKLYLKEPLGDTSNFTILTTWDKKCAYPFSSFHMADIHAAKFEGAVEEEAER
ncbi:DUF1642 domain-containing protein [Enterococcus faecium]|uniref:DUF1642 domain-containing protein n=1 Tax=Enterococcus faecium TaxID=1352 RepID=UPI0009B55580|nr:DUF1642 domain-containing protein [Enterococcus faecium]